MTLAAEPLRAVYGLDIYQGGIAYVADGQVRASYAAANGLGEGFVEDVQARSERYALGGHRGRAQPGERRTRGDADEQERIALRRGSLVIEDDAHSVWLYMACGLVRIARPELDAWAAAVDKTEANTDARPTIQATVFDSSDGVRTQCHSASASARRSPSPRTENCGSCPGMASASSIRDTCLQQTSAAGAHRADHRRPPDLRDDLPAACGCPR